MPDVKDRIIIDAIEALRATVEGLKTNGAGEWAEMNRKIADHLEKRHREAR